MDFTSPEFILRIPAILLALTVHEVAHGYVAFARGDATARDAGRLTLNPLAHLDVFGTMMLFFGPFGWAKPVPVNGYNLDNPRRDLILVSLAGPASNIVLAIILGYTLRLIEAFNPALAANTYLIAFFSISIYINIGISFFNLIPVPPLDGSQILAGLLPASKVAGYYQKMRYVPLVFLVMIVAEWMLHIPVFSAVLTPIFKPYASLWYFLIFWR